MNTKNYTILRDLYKKYELTEEDVFKHKHYVIITRAGIDKIQAKASINIEYEVISCSPNYCVVKACATVNENKIQTFGSALNSGDLRNGSTNSWYVMEMAEKRAMSRAVLKLTGFYASGAMGEDESEDFKKPKANTNHVSKVDELIKSSL